MDKNLSTPVYGTLYIVATPIGNLEDLTFRARRILEEVDIIACEDTRKTKKLLNHYGILTKTMRYDEHSHEIASQRIVDILSDNGNVALVSSAGTPVISDPGARLIEEVRKSGIEIISIPGPCALSSSLSVSGIRADNFIFLGFLPKRAGRRRSILEKVKGLDMPLVIYLPPRNLKKRFDEFIGILGDRRGCLCRELTKLFETKIAGKLSEIAGEIEDEERGEITLVIDRDTGDNNEERQRER